jgi:polyisoprenoid-binding protein YceI
MPRLNVAQVALVALAILAGPAVPAEAGSVPVRIINSAASTATFSVEHIYVERVNGSVPIVQGEIYLQQGTVIPLGVYAVLDPTKIKTGEDDRDGALQSPDWFDTKKFPTWTFQATKIVPSGTSAFSLDGTLTIHGVARTEHLDVTVSGTPEHPHYHAVGKIDRHAFGMHVTRLDPVVGNDVDVALDVTLQ